MAHIPDTSLTRQFVDYEGEYYLGKITLRPYYSSLPARLLVWTLLFPATYLVFSQVLQALSRFKHALSH